MNEQLKTRQEHDNAEDEFAVALYEDDPNPGETVGHVPKEMSRIFWQLFCSTIGRVCMKLLAQRDVHHWCKVAQVKSMDDNCGEWVECVGMVLRR